MYYSQMKHRHRPSHFNPCSRGTKVLIQLYHRKKGPALKRKKSTTVLLSDDEDSTPPPKKKPAIAKAIATKPRASISKVTPKNKKIEDEDYDMESAEESDDDDDFHEEEDISKKRKTSLKKSAIPKPSKSRPVKKEDEEPTSKTSKVPDISSAPPAKKFECVWPSSPHVT